MNDATENLKYISGFNDGYLIASKEPELFDKVINGIKAKNHDYVQGLYDGKQQYEKELAQKKERMARLNSLLPDKDKGIDLGRG